jgi:predicted Zn-dependent protease
MQTLALAALLGGCASHTVFNPVTEKPEFSAVSDAELNRQAAEARDALIDEHGRYADTRLDPYITALGLKIAAVSHRPALPWSFTVLDTEVGNAFALPGGQVFVTRGLLAQLQNEGELAAVLGHEIGHVTARHGNHRANDAAFASVGVNAAIGVGQFLERNAGLRGAEARMKRIGLSLAAGWIATYSREQELEADRLGAEYIARAGYDARHLVSVVQMLGMVERFNAEQARAEKREAAASDWLTSHPATERRLREAERITAAARQVDDDGRQRFLAAIDGLVFGDSPEKGLVRERLFVHPRAGYAITAPEGWDIDIEGSAAALHTPEGDATLTVRLVPTLAGNTHLKVIDTLLSPAEGRSFARRVGGFEATHFVGSRRRGDVLQPLRSTVVTGPGGRFFLIDYTARDPEALQRALKPMEAAERSFRRITEADRRAAQPWRVRSARMGPGGFAELAKATPLGDKAEATLRLLNGLYGVPAGEVAEPAVGSRVKTVR